MLKNLNEIGRGVHKKWIYKSEMEYELSCDYLQKMSYSIMDFNCTLEDIKGRGDICFLILLVTWIKEGYEQIEKLINKNVIKGYTYSEDQYAVEAKRYIKALRSFVVAHPLTTNRHEEFGMDGDYVCIDISVPAITTVLKAFNPTSNYYELTMNGLNRTSSLEICDYSLYVYSKKDNAQFFKYFGCKISDLEKVARIYIDKLYSLDKFLAYKRKKDYV